MKARTVKGIEPETPLADAAQRIARVRLDELCALAPRALDPDERVALHDLRIAAKRLRYLLELTGFCFGAYASEAAKRARALQDAIGEVHDCDVLAPRALARLHALRVADAQALRAAAGEGDLSPAALADAPHRNAYKGLELLVAHLSARRELLFERFVGDWAALERQRFAERLLEALAQRPGAAPDAGGRS